jgi:hypothetical protein
MAIPVMAQEIVIKNLWF